MHVLQYGEIRPAQWIRHLVKNRMTNVNSILRHMRRSFDYDALYKHFVKQFSRQVMAFVKSTLWLKIFEPLKRMRIHYSILSCTHTHTHTHTHTERIVSVLNKIDHKVFQLDWTYKSWHLHTSAKTAAALDPLVAAQENGLIAAPGEIDTAGPTLSLDQIVLSDGETVLSEDETSAASSDEAFEVDWNAILRKNKQSTQSTGVRGSCVKVAGTKAARAKARPCKAARGQHKPDHTLHRSKEKQLKYAAMLFAGDGHFLMAADIVPIGEADDYTVPVVSKSLADNMQQCHCKKTDLQVRIDGIQTGVLLKIFQRIAADHYDADTFQSLMTHIPSGSDYDIRQWIEQGLAKVCLCLCLSLSIYLSICLSINLSLSLCSTDGSMFISSSQKVL